VGCLERSKEGAAPRYDQRSFCSVRVSIPCRSSNERQWTAYVTTSILFTDDYFAATAMRNHSSICTRASSSWLPFSGRKIEASPSFTSNQSLPSASTMFGLRVLLFCIASGTDWQKVGVTGETVTVMVVKGLVERDAAGRLSLAGKGGRRLRRC
jgi:hypothetical protein